MFSFIFETKKKPWNRENQIKQHKKKINWKKECKNCFNFFISCECVAENEAGKINGKGLRLHTKVDVGVSNFWKTTEMLVIVIKPPTCTGKKNSGENLDEIFLSWKINKWRQERCYGWIFFACFLSFTLSPCVCVCVYLPFQMSRFTTTKVVSSVPVAYNTCWG